MCRGDARQQIFREEADYQRLVDGLTVTVNRFGWELLSFVQMPNHFQLFHRTPQPSLSRGMQFLGRSHSDWFAKRNRYPGHRLQGRFKSQSVEDESYFWSVSRYVQLNSVRGKKPPPSHPRVWLSSSYPRYALRRVFPVVLTILPTCCNYL
jgi:putative transposase